MHRQQVARRRLQDVLRHSGLASVDAARLRFADIVLEPLPTLVRNRAQDDDGPVVVDLDVLPVGHEPRLASVAMYRQRGQRRRHRSNNRRKANERAILTNDYAERMIMRSLLGLTTAKN